MESIASQLEHYTTTISGFEESRNYLSLSNAAQDYSDLLYGWEHGFKADHMGLLKCYKGYQMEQDLLKRLVALFGDRITLKYEISVFDGKVKGHPDFLFDGLPGDCKAVPLDEHLPVVGKLPKKTNWQLQAYMKYMDKPRGVALYESRETGRIKEYWLPAMPPIQAQIHEKYSKLVQAIQ